MQTNKNYSVGRLSDTRLTRREFITRALGVGVSLSAAGTLLSACGGEEGNNKGSDAAGAITFVGAWDQATLASAIEGFKKSQPDIDITNTNYPFAELNSVIQSRMQSKSSGFDVYAADQPRVPGFAARGYLFDLSDIASEAERKVLETSYEASSWNDTLYSLPMWTSEQVLYYNRELLDNAGVEPPSIDPEERWTWDKTVTAAKETQSAGAKWGLMFSQVNRYYQLQPLPESLGGGPGLTGANMLEPAITNEGWIRAFDWYGNLFSEGVSPKGVPPEQTPSLFANGELAFFVGIPSDPVLEEAKRKGKIDWGVAAHPYFAGGTPVTATDSWSLGINPYSEKQEAALEFIKYLSLSKDGNSRTIEEVPVIPVNSESFESYMDKLSGNPRQPENINELVNYELENTARHRPRTIGYVEFETAMNDAFTNIANGADARSTLQKTTDQLNRDLEPLRREIGGG